MPEPQEGNWGKKNTPEIPLSASLQGVGNPNDQTITIQNNLKTPVGSTVGEAVGKHIFTQEGEAGKGKDLETKLLKPTP